MNAAAPSDVYPDNDGKAAETVRTRDSPKDTPEQDDRVAHASARPGLFDAGRAFDTHGTVLLGFAVNALRDRPLAEDCVQETFLRAWRSRERFDSDRASERTWLFAIARNVIADALRTRSRMPRIGGEDELEQHAAPVIDPLERLGIVEGLARLSEPHREVILAVHVEGRTYQELSDATGVPVATWRTRAYHALRAMRGYLEDSAEDSEGAS